MYYYEFTIHYLDGKVSFVSVYQQEFDDEIGYCQEGKNSGWITDYSYKVVKEEW